MGVPPGIKYEFKHYGSETEWMAHARSCLPPNGRLVAVDVGNLPFSGPIVCVCDQDGLTRRVICWDRGQRRGN